MISVCGLDVSTQGTLSYMLEVFVAGNYFPQMRLVAFIEGTQHALMCGEHLMNYLCAFKTLAML